jgi:hypothetical protein
VVEHRALDVYLNDHLAAATGACELVERFQAGNEDTPLGNFSHSWPPRSKKIAKHSNIL